MNPSDQLSLPSQQLADGDDDAWGWQLWLQLTEPPFDLQIPLQRSVDVVIEGFDILQRIPLLLTLSLWGLELLLELLDWNPLGARGPCGQLRGDLIICNDFFQCDTLRGKGGSQEGGKRDHLHRSP
jgi:hypothetical protein